MLAMLAAATAEEFWRGRDEPLMSRWPTVIVLLAYAGALLARIPATYFSPMLDDQSLMSGVSFALLAFGTLLFTVVMAFLLLNMTKERTELQHKIASLVDPFSGVANRRAFLNGSNRLFAQQAVDREPLAMLLFDLDRFKEINDRFGHAVGDRVLLTFAPGDRTLGADVLFGRIGGEEFASMLPVGDLGEAYAIADRVRRNFAEAAARFAERRSAPTVSVGVTLGVDAKADVELAGGRRRSALSRQGQRPQPRGGDGAARRDRGAGLRALDRAADRAERVGQADANAAGARRRALSERDRAGWICAFLIEPTHLPKPVGGACTSCSPWSDLSVLIRGQSARCAFDRRNALASDHRTKRFLPRMRIVFAIFHRKATAIAETIHKGCKQSPRAFGRTMLLTIARKPEGFRMLAPSRTRRSRSTSRRCSSSRPASPRCSACSCCWPGCRTACARSPGGEPPIWSADSRWRSGASRA